MRLLITRPEADARSFADKLAERGVDSVIAPVMTVVFNEGLNLDLDDTQAVLLTSANGGAGLGARHGTARSRRCGRRACHSG